MNEQRDNYSVMRGALKIIVDQLEDNDVNGALLVAKFALVNEIAYGEKDKTANG